MQQRTLARSVAYLITRQTFRLLSSERASERLLTPLEGVARILLVERGDPVKIGPRRQREDKFYIATNLLRATLRAYHRSAPAVQDRILNLFIREFLELGAKEEKRRRFRARYLIDPPEFLTISPEGRCNLNCPDCYAGSGAHGLPHLSAATVERILKEKYEEWGSWFTVVSGGEPFIWNDGGVDLIELARRHPEQYFLVYTNGTLISEEIAHRLAAVGNITPAISVEGFEAETDARRGRGVFRRILNAFDRLRRAGVPFGISVTATRSNAELILSEEMIRYYFDEQGAVYMWVFQYMPIGRGVDIAAQVPPEVRERLWHREQELVRRERRFVVDFWNGGTFSSGCISAGRSGGYLYIDWNGNIYPCVFVPYWQDNINELYAQGKSLSDALVSELFVAIRNWQRSYNYQHPPETRGNEIRPCFIRDHHETAHRIILNTGAQPGYPSAQTALTDPSYYRGMVEYDRRLAELLDPIWERLYRMPHRN